MRKFPHSLAQEEVALRSAGGASLSRRSVLATAAAGGALLAAGSAQAATFGNPDEPPQGAINSTPGALSDPRPRQSDAAVAIPECGQSARDGRR